ncbi:molybdopterin molybdotransferase MoeA [Siccirubricoccus sp. KC 17139]|uniref:Molybdopterin molybdenumtransferase n=1 Tax=Siccirubricoccus soli TaxID=2899147 RepID=A0ABT1D4C5_9PROT|nr:gephyrin-like molybdotransferase Glp [Siccirubricoccus soli]MCO6416771.1 molybdopterin molybdotransferase MoeA [Siccirubricoccus soli]MCP2682906.1 molybdopterin molybdotransferase MoeA [Siccirubricoccus soli]
MISVEDARSRILASLGPTPAETIPLPAAWGRVLARPVVARLTQPPADVSAMDGYAVRAADAVEGATLAVTGTAPAGHPYAGVVGPGEAVRIFTGGFIPQGADAILLQEDAAPDSGRVRVNETVKPGRWVRRQGLDFAAGEKLLPAGRRLTARDIGLAAAANHPWLTVHRAPRIGILATGDEIALPGEPIPPGGIVSSNAHALAALVRAGGGDPLVLPIAPDDTSTIAEAARAARACDLLVTTGGASVGDHDLVQAALGPEGFTLDFWQIAMRPGKPLIWGMLGPTPVLGLPGNPVSALVCAVQFLLPALARLSGGEAGPPRTVPARTGVALAANDRRFDHLRARLETGPEGGLVATPFPVQDSSMLKTLARAEGLVLRAPHAPALPAGAPVEVIPLGELGI